MAASYRHNRLNMKQVQSYLAVLCVILALAPPAFAQQPADQTGPAAARPASSETRIGGWYSNVKRRYQSTEVAPINVSNSGRIDQLLRAGNLYLSLSDAIALAIENSLDVEIERYDFQLAQADVLRAQSGASIQGVPTNVLAGVPTGAGALLGSVNSGLNAGNVLTSLGNGLSFDPFLTSGINFGLSNNSIHGNGCQIPQHNNHGTNGEHRNELSAMSLNVHLSPPLHQYIG